MDQLFSVTTNNDEETMLFAEKLAKTVGKGVVFTLIGDLGAGKTTFVKGLALGLNIKEKVLSPTFNILKCYFNKPLNLYHIDAYRLEDANKDIGLEEFIDGDGVCAIEWPMYIDEYIPTNRLEINLTHLNNNKREALISSNIDKLNDLFEALKG